MAEPTTLPKRRPLPLRAKVAAARVAGAGSRALGRGGTSLPGKLLLAMEPDAVGRLASELPLGTAVISATNGKTTTTAMAASILENAGHRLVHNRTGANMAGGLAGALMARPRDADLGLLEIDEFWLPGLVDQLEPRVVLLGNLFRDQLDRYGELETIAARWQEMVDRHPETMVVLNADDPLVADLGRDRIAPESVCFYGIEDTSVAREGLAHAADAKHCRRCGAPYRYDAVMLAHLGHYHCDACGAARPRPAVVAKDIELRGLAGSALTIETPAGSCRVELPIPGLYNIYNALAAAALGVALGARTEQIQAGLTGVAPAFGRGESVSIGGQELLLLLVKNPAGANEVLRTLALEPGDHHLLAVLNDQIADGRDISWIWDADYELLESHVGRAVCSGSRAAEMALRLKYAGVDPGRIVVVPDLEDALDTLLAGAPGRDGRLAAIPTYTAMLALREELVRRGAAEGSFS